MSDKRRFLITGGSQGIGAATVEAAREAGHDVVFTGRNQELIEQVAGDLAGNPEASISTIATPLVATGEFFDVNVVKVVTDRAGFALYFSRAPIPWDRDLLNNGVKALPIGIVPLRHIGIYAYRAGYLRRYAQMRPCPLEQAEQLEQLRALWYGERIHVAEASQRPGPGVDTEDDLVIAEQLLQAKINGDN